MLYVLIGVVAGAIVFGLIRGEMWDVDAIWIGVLAGLVGLAVAYSLASWNGVTDPDYKSYTKAYELKEIHQNQYYTTNADGDSVSIWIMDGSTWKKRTFSEKQVTFQATTGQAEVQIESKKMVKPKKLDNVWFFIDTEGKKKEIVTSVVISVPEDSEITSQPVIEEAMDNENEGEAKVEEIQPEEESSEKKNYCSSCGEKVSDSANFCSGCGKKLE